MEEVAGAQPSSSSREERPLGLIPLFAYLPRDYGHEQREDFLQDVSGILWTPVLDSNIS
jgi:hypothetical protein